MADALFELSHLGPIVVATIDAELGQTEWKGGGPDSGPVVGVIQSTVGDMIAAGTQTGVTVTYDSEAGSLSFAADGGGATTFLGLSDIPDTAEEGQIAVYRDGTFVFEAKPTASGTPSWGDIDGTLASQTDLATALDGKADADDPGLLSTADRQKLDASVSTADLDALGDLIADDLNAKQDAATAVTSVAASDEIAIGNIVIIPQSTYEAREAAETLDPDTTYLRTEG